MDSIVDTCFALESFQSDPSGLFKNNPYLLTYGLLQALIIQQDAVNYLIESLLGSDHVMSWRNNENITLANIRQLRDETIGHPVRREENLRKSEYTKDEITSCTIDRSTLTKEGFWYILWKYSKTENKAIIFADIIDRQDGFLSTKLNSIMGKLEKEEKIHRENFKGNNLTNLLNDTSFYEISLIGNMAWGDNIGFSNFNYFYKQYNQVRTWLEERYGKIEDTLGIQGTIIIIKKLDYIFSKVETFTELSELNKYEIEVYTDVLIFELNKLKLDLVEIDKIFK